MLWTYQLHKVGYSLSGFFNTQIVVRQQADRRYQSQYCNKRKGTQDTAILHDVHLWTPQNPASGSCQSATGRYKQLPDIKGTTDSLTAYSSRGGVAVSHQEQGFNTVLLQRDIWP